MDDLCVQPGGIYLWWDIASIRGTGYSQLLMCILQSFPSVQSMSNFLSKLNRLHVSSRLHIRLRCTSFFVFPGAAQRRYEALGRPFSAKRRWISWATSSAKESGEFQTTPGQYWNISGNTWSVLKHFRQRLGQCWNISGNTWSVLKHFLSLCSAPNSGSSTNGVNHIMELITLIMNPSSGFHRDCFNFVIVKEIGICSQC